jgi:3-dehydroquinate dehydratase-2
MTRKTPKQVGNNDRLQPLPGTVYVLNGPNINLLGIREPHIYGHETLADINARLVTQGEKLGLTVKTFQSNHEGALIDWLHEANAAAPRR